ncbi:MAG: translation elongation factor Ts [Oscillospiraceae bacterium]|jgi:elongation factor Ts|nr:translation elongation factor Ts [Oscillospiraceae bacterium]
MASFTAKDVKDLREKTGVGMMECKKALAEADGDFEKAVEILRERGLAAAVKKGGRIAADGIVYAAVRGNAGLIIEVNSETDFAARSEKFNDFVATVADIVLEKAPADLDALLALPADETFTVDGLLKENILRIGENLKIRRFERREGVLSSYIHAGGNIGVLVEFDTDVAGRPEFAVFAKDMALQIAAMAPKYVSSAEIPESEIVSEKEIFKAQAMAEGKPENIATKMVAGRIQKFYSEVCLLNQVFVKDDKISVDAWTKQTAKELGGNIAIKGFTRYEKGEGIEKKADDFAAEVASMVK